MAIIAATLLILLPQIWVMLHDKSAAWRVGVLSVSFLITTVILLLATTRTLTTSTASERAYQDTYYVISHFHYVFSYALILGGLAVLLALADPALRPLPKVSRWLATLLALSTLELMIRPLLLPFWTPQRYVEYEAWFALNARVGLISGLVFGLLWCALCAIGLYGGFRRLNEWSKSKEGKKP